MTSLRSRFEKVRHVKGNLLAKGKRFGVVVSTFNEFLTSQLLEGALETLAQTGAKQKDIHVVHVPGAFEIPLAAKKLIASRKPHAVITLAVVIRGKTKHFDQVSRESARGVRELSMKTEVPIILGIIPAQNVRQATERVGLKQMNKGREWALCAVEMANLMADLSKPKTSR